jgi:hypothetical protein
MQYEKPNLEIILLPQNDIVCSSPNVGVGKDDNDSDWT